MGSNEVYSGQPRNCTIGSTIAFIIAGAVYTFVGHRLATKVNVFIGILLARALVSGTRTIRGVWGHAYPGKFEWKRVLLRGFEIEAHYL